MTAAPKATQEQERARDAFASGGDLAVVAGAGTGKTSTLVLMARATRQRGIYMAFNRAAADDARHRFPPNVECRTAHSIAFRAVGREYRGRLDSARLPSAQTARILGIRHDFDAGGPRIGVLQQARLVMNMVRRFCYSSDPVPMPRHMEPVNGLDDRGAEYLAVAMGRFAEKAWNDLQNPRGQLRFEHDHYMKMWALRSPRLPGDFVLLDEAQDTNPVLEAVFLAQSAQRVCVGDPAQQIYAWRAARDVMTGFPAPQVRLTRSFRFGQPIAAVANRWLGHAGSDLRLTGAGPPSRVGPAPEPADAVLCRGNADVLREVLGFLDANVPVAITGGGDALRKMAEAARQLKAGHRTTHPELFLFPDWASVQEYAEHDGAAAELKSLVKLVDTYGENRIVDAVDKLSPESLAKVTVSTAHKAKGREWPSVRIGPGFEPPPLDDHGIQTPLGMEEARLIYVAVTRARQSLDISGLKWADAYERAIAPVTRAALIDLPLTGQVRRPASPLSRFLADHLPGAGRVVRDYMERTGDLPRPVQPADDVRKPAWKALGYAIGFRLRLSLGCELGESVALGVAAFGTGVSPGAGDEPLRGAPSDPATRRALHECGRALLTEVSAYVTGRPDRRGRGLWTEERLSRLCFVAAFYEDVFRTGAVRRRGMLGSPDAGAGVAGPGIVDAGVTLDDLAAAVPRYAVDDIAAQLRLGERVFGPLRALPRREVACGAVLAGSPDIGGADADFILGGLLLDCKTTTMPRKLGAEDINQLAGYLLLDYRDEFRVTRAGLYLSRQGAVIDWDLATFLEMLGARTPLADLRRQLRAYLRQWRDQAPP